MGLAALLVLSACDVTAPGTDEGLKLKEARERWEAHGFASYSIDETRTCECLGPWAYTVVVEKADVIDVLYQEEPGYNYISKDQLLGQLQTVDQYFETLEGYLETAERFEVEYDATYGYPSRIYIDPTSRMADNELVRTLSNLRQLN